MKSFIKNLLIVFVGFLSIGLVFLSSCTSEQSKISPPSAQEIQYVKKVEPIREYDAILECISSQRTFFADQPVRLRFKLTNLSTKKLVIPDWMQVEEYNIKLHYRFLKLNDGQISPVSDWKCLSPELKPPVRRQTIELNYNTSCLIEKSFQLSELSLPEDFYTEPYFLNLVAELNLESIKLRSEPITINFK